MKFRIKINAEVEAESAEEANGKVADALRLILDKGCADCRALGITRYALDALNDSGKPVYAHAHDEFCL